MSTYYEITQRQEKIIKQLCYELARVQPRLPEKEQKTIAEFLDKIIIENGITYYENNYIW